MDPKEDTGDAGSAFAFAGRILARVKKTLFFMGKMFLFFYFYVITCLLKALFLFSTLTPSLREGFNKNL